MDTLVTLLVDPVDMVEKERDVMVVMELEAIHSIGKNITLEKIAQPKRSTTERVMDLQVMALQAMDQEDQVIVRHIRSMGDTGDMVRVMDQEDQVIVRIMGDMVDPDQRDMGDMEREGTEVRDMGQEAMDQEMVRNMEDMVDRNQQDMGDMDRDHTAVRVMVQEAMVQEGQEMVRNMEDMVDLDQRDMGDMDRDRTEVRAMDREAMDQEEEAMEKEHQAIVRQK